MLEKVTNIEPASRLPRMNKSARRDCFRVSTNLFAGWASWTAFSIDFSKGATLMPRVVIAVTSFHPYSPPSGSVAYQTVEPQHFFSPFNPPVLFWFLKLS
jgi:hypothetical protein